MKYTMSGRGFASAAPAVVAAAALCFVVLASVMAAEPTTNAPAMSPAPGATPAKGEFDNSCAMGLASGQLVKTDCSVNWTAPDGKIYCFSTERSKLAFLKDPDENIRLSLRTPMRHTIAVGRAGCGGRGSGWRLSVVDCAGAMALLYCSPAAPAEPQRQA